MVYSMKYACLVATFSLAMISAAMADGPADNLAKESSSPPGISISPDDATRLKAGLAKLDEQIAGLHPAAINPLLAELPDVEIYAKAMRYAVRLPQILTAQIAVADKLLARAVESANALAKGVSLGTGLKHRVRRTSACLRLKDQRLPSALPDR